MHVALTEEQATWMIQGAASMIVAARDAANLPSIAQALGCRISASRTQVTLFVPAVAGASLRGDLRATGDLAVTFTNSRTTRSLQLKARGVREVPLVAGDDDRISAHIGALVREWTSTGLPELVARALLDRGDGTFFAIELEPYIAFDQTPGPRAGAPLG